MIAALVVVAAVAHQGGSGDDAPAAGAVDAEVQTPASPSPSPALPSVTSSVTSPATSSATSAGEPPTPSPSRTADRPASGTALAALATLAVKGRAPMTGYARDRFGYAWLDADRNGCDTRNDLLRRDLTGLVLKPGTDGCVVLRGRLADPYTGQPVAFERGGADDVDIDHVVALGNAWVTGAFRWDVHRRAALANDPLELLAVDYRPNRQKGDGDAATWLPPRKAFRCAYVARQVAVKQKYGLWVTAPERAAMQRVLLGCPDQPLPPDRWHAPLRVDHDIHDPGPPGAPASPEQRPEPKPQPFAGQDVHYDNCDAVRAAGAAPIHRGEPGYASHLDRDGDGVGCE